MKRVFSLSFIVAMLACLPVRGADLDFGDRTSETLTVKAWKALEAKNYKDTVVYANKCVEMYEKQAIEMQKELKEPVPTDNREAVSKKWALNDVGTCLFIIGQAMEKQDKNPEALASYKKLLKEVRFAQCWDPKGWFWKPADAAKARIVALEYDTQK